jgi:hypothetical protein
MRLAPRDLAHMREARRNPLAALPAVDRLRMLEPSTRSLLREILSHLRRDARARAERWRTRKAPMAAYWAAVSVYAGHLARLLR